MDLPLLVLAGAPKCGTTALAWSLSGHPDVVFSIPKEPYWFGSDLAPLRVRQGLSPREGYDQVFPHRAAGTARMRAEGSTLYMSSPDALSHLVAAEPEARIVIAVRNPTDLAAAFHRQLVFVGFEPVEDFAEAWHAQESRLVDPPRSCPVPRLLQYREIASIGSQLINAIDLMGRERVYVMFQEDLEADPARTLAGVASFLGLGLPSLVPPPPVNTASEPRSRSGVRALGARPVRIALNRFKASAPPRATAFMTRTKERLLRRPTPAAPISEDLRAAIARELQPEVELLERVIGHSCDAWGR